MIPSIILLSASLIAAQPADKGYVVRADSGTVWLDLTAADGAAAGRPFEIYTEGPVLKHPVTGASLGRVRDVVAEGTIQEVAEKYSTGLLSLQRRPAAAGQRARLVVSASPAPAAPASPAPSETASRAPITQGAALDFEVDAMAVGDFDGGGRPQVALASENAIKLYSYPVLDPKPLAEFALTGAGVRVVGLEAGDYDGEKLFVSVYDQPFARFETRVLALSGKTWRQVADLPFLTRSYQDERGRRVLATQQVIDDNSFPFGALYPLAYQDGKFSQGRPALNLRRADWIYGFTTAGFGPGEPAVIYLTSVHALRVQFGKEWWRTPDEDYGQTPVRARWQNRVLEFNPPLIVSYAPSGFDSLYALRNFAAFGGLAAPLGYFNRGELVAKRWNGLSLETAWKADLSGCAQGLAMVDDGGRRELAVAIRGSAGRSSVWTFAP